MQGQRKAWIEGINIPAVVVCVFDVDGLGEGRGKGDGKKSGDY